MYQSKLQSLCESVVNVLIGGLISIAIQLLFFPVIGINAELWQNIIVWIVFATASVIRGYVVRRWFNNKLTDK